VGESLFLIIGLVRKTIKRAFLKRERLRAISCGVPRDVLNYKLSGGHPEFDYSLREKFSLSAEAAGKCLSARMVKFFFILFAGVVQAAGQKPLKKIREELNSENFLNTSKNVPAWTYVWAGYP
jgi:hypothetical protein